jgi:hypothetical protein
MENSVKQARWVLMPVFGLWAAIALVGALAA